MGLVAEPVVALRMGLLPTTVIESPHLRRPGTEQGAGNDMVAGTAGRIHGLAAEIAGGHDSVFVLAYLLYRARTYARMVLFDSISDARQVPLKPPLPPESQPQPHQDWRV